MNDLFAMCGSGRSGTSCHSLMIFHAGGNDVLADSGAKLAITHQGIAGSLSFAFLALGILL
jgi:hypothetical protein